MAEMFMILNQKNGTLLAQSANVRNTSEQDQLNNTAKKGISMINDLIENSEKNFFYSFYTEEQNVSLFVTTDGLRILTLTKGKDRNQVYTFINDIFDYYRTEYFSESEDFYDRGASDDFGSYFSVAR